MLFSVLDVLFDGGDQCRVRANVRVALGSLLTVPKEPGLTHAPAFGETVQQVANGLMGLGVALHRPNAVAGAQTLMMQILPDIRAGGLTDTAAALQNSGLLGLRHVDLGDRSSFDVSAWLGGGVLEIAGTFAATGELRSATIRTAVDVGQSTAHYTGLTHDAAILLSDGDPLGAVQATTHRVRQRGSLPLVDDVSLVGSPASVTVGNLAALTPDAFACGIGASPLNVGATIVPGRVAARTAIAFIGSSRYGTVWSADAVKLLVQFCWDSGTFPRSIKQVSGVRLIVEGVEQDADAISYFQLDTLDAIGIEYNSNGRTDVLYTHGMARVVPRLIRLHDGRELVAKDPHDPVFAPSSPMAWQALGGLTEGQLPVTSPDLLLFESEVTRGVTSRLGRPFTEPSSTAVVTDSRLSAPFQRAALLVT